MPQPPSGVSAPSQPQQVPARQEPSGEEPVATTPVPNAAAVPQPPTAKIPGTPTPPVKKKRKVTQATPRPEQMDVNAEQVTDEIAALFSPEASAAAAAEHPADALLAMPVSVAAVEPLDYAAIIAAYATKNGLDLAVILQAAGFAPPEPADVLALPTPAPAVSVLALAPAAAAAALASTPAHTKALGEEGAEDMEDEEEEEEEEEEAEVKEAIPVTHKGTRVQQLTPPRMPISFTPSQPA